MAQKGDYGFLLKIKRLDLERRGEFSALTDQAFKIWCSLKKMLRKCSRSSLKKILVILGDLFREFVFYMLRTLEMVEG